VDEASSVVIVFVMVVVFTVTVDFFAESEFIVNVVIMMYPPGFNYSYYGLWCNL
jgi:hypothetical protein